MKNRGGRKPVHKIHILKFMLENPNENGYSVKALAPLVELTENLTRESLQRLVDDEEVFRFPDKNTYKYFTKNQEAPKVKGFANLRNIDPSIISWRKKK